MNDKKDNLEEIISRLSNPNYEWANYALPENANSLDKSKYKVCQSIALYKRENGLAERDLLYDLKVSETELDNILYCRINFLNLENLTKHLEKLNIPFHLEINNQGESAVLKH